LGLGRDNLLNIRNALLKDLLQNLGVLELLLDLGNNGRGELLLLALLNLALVTHPGLKDRLGLSGDGGLLLELESLGLKLGGFLGNGEEVLGNVDDTGHLLDVLNASLDGLSVVRPGAVEDVLDLLVLSLSPGLVAGTTVLDETTPDGEQADSDDGLLVHDVVLAAQGVDAEGSAGAEDGGLADEAVTGEGIEDALGLLLGLLGGDIARVADGSGGDGREGTAGDGRSEEGGAYKESRQTGAPSVSKRSRKSPIGCRM
jgi:hypothetical protein